MAPRRQGSYQDSRYLKFYINSVPFLHLFPRLLMKSRYTTRRNTVGKRLVDRPNPPHTTGERLASPPAQTSRKENSMKNLVSNTLKAFCAWAVLGISCLCAQSGHMLIANVPFDFSVV